MTRTRTVWFGSTVKGGLPVSVTAKIHPAEPDIGIFGEQVEITSITFPRGGEVPNVSESDEQRLQEEALEGEGW